MLPPFALASTKGVTFYDCKVTDKIDGLVLAFAALVRYDKCRYASTMSSTHGNRQFTRKFKFCG